MRSPKSRSTGDATTHLAALPAERGNRVLHRRSHSTRPVSELLSGRHHRHQGHDLHRRDPARLELPRLPAALCGRSDGRRRSAQHGQPRVGRAAAQHDHDRPYIVQDTTSVPIVVDSSRFRLTILRRDTSATNLKLRVYRLPITTDSNSTFASLDPDFTAAPIDTVNVSQLLARPPIVDTAKADSANRRIFGDTTRTDSAGHILTVADSGRTLTLYFHFDTVQAPFVATDSGQLALDRKSTRLN